MTAVTAERYEKPKTGVRNCSIDIARCIAALFVIINHTAPLSDSGLTVLSDFITSVGSASISFFFMTAGYFFVCGIMKGKKVLLPYLKKMLIPYTVWSALYLLVDFFKYGKETPVEFLKSCFPRFFIVGTAYHFWYFPAAMVSAILVALFFRLRLEKLLLPVSFLGFSVLAIGNYYSEIFILKNPTLFAQLTVFAQSNPAINRMFLMGFPYFCGGYLVKLLMDRNGFIRRNSAAFTAACAVFLVVEFIFLYRHGMSSWSVFGHYFISVPLILLLLDHPMPEKKKAAARCRAFAGFSYYAHPAMIMAVDSLYSLVFKAVIPSALRFVLVCVLCAVLSAAVMKADNKYLNMIAS